MSTLTVRAKLTWAFGILAVLVLLVAGLAIQTLSEGQQRFDNYVNGVAFRVSVANKVRQAVDARAIAARDLTIVTSPGDIASTKATVEKAHAEVTEHLKHLKDLVNQPGVAQEVREMVAAIDKVEQAYAPVALSIVSKALQGDKEGASAQIIAECRPLLTALGAATEKYAAFVKTQSETLVQEATDSYAAQRALLVTGCAVALAAAVVAGVLITRSLTRALGAEPHELCDAVSRVADGDLTARLKVSGGDSASVMAAVKRMQESLIRVVTSVRTGSDSVATASAEIASGNQDLSARTEQQASSLEETAASMEELGTTVRHNADNASQANQLAQRASEVAVQGGTVVSEVVDTMKDINDSSRKIADIISVIDGIAFQTNILALNAAVEAARAGEQGRGFAVVASEVRSLAQRSAAAAKEIKDLITDSVSRVEAGTALADKAGMTMEEVVTSIRRVTDIVGEISSASAQQSAGVGQVGEAVSSMDQATQQNAALVEEMAASADSLSMQAQSLVQAVSVFKMDTSGQAAPAVRLAPIAKAPVVPRAPVESKPAPVQKRQMPAPREVPQPKLPKASPAPKADAAGEWDSF
jgi:methyl-accepting chemotaxis protein-1 (serine sensor receptor)